MRTHTDSQVVTFNEDGSRTIETVETIYPASKAEKATAVLALSALVVAPVLPILMAVGVEKAADYREKRRAKKLAKKNEK